MARKRVAPGLVVDCMVLQPGQDSIDPAKAIESGKAVNEDKASFSRNSVRSRRSGRKIDGPLSGHTGESGAILKELLISCGDIVFRTGPDGKEFREIDGKKIPDEKSSLSFESVHPEDHDSVFSSIGEAARRTVPYRIEYRFIRNDGSVGWAVSHAVPVMDDKGKITGWFGSATDITKYKTAEENLLRIARSDRQIKEILNRIGDHFYVLDRDWNFVYANLEFTSKFGNTPDDFIGKDIRTIFPRQQGTDFERNIREAMEKRETRRFETAERHVCYSISVFPCMEGVAVLETDITERKRNERELAKTREQLETVHHRLEAVLDATPSAIVLVDARQKLSYINERAMELYGFDYRGTDLNEHASAICALKPDGLPFPIEEMPVSLSFMSGKRIFNVEMIIRRYDGSRIPILVSSAPLFDEKGIVELVIMVFDEITRQVESRRRLQELVTVSQRQAAELNAANKELEAFSYSISHEIRDPLNRIGIMTQGLDILYGRSLNEKGRECLAHIQKGVFRMGEVISDMLKLSCISRQQLKRERADLGAIAAEIAEDLRKGSPGRHADIMIQEGLQAEADIALLVLAMDNLLRNAWKYTSKCAHAIIEVGATEVQGAKAFFVRDNGTGFDMKDSERIFSAFQRAHSPKEYEGTGIGLSIVKRIVEKHGGKIWAESEHGKGACFHFTLS